MTEPGAFPRLARKRALARAALWFEQVWSAIAPSLGILGVFLVIALLNVPAVLPPWPRTLLPGVFALAALGLLVWRLTWIVPPSDEAVDRRLERETGLRHRPLAALQDHPAVDSEEGAALWRLHQARLAAQMGRLRAGYPHLDLAIRDRWALRGLVVVALAAASGIAGVEARGRVLTALWPGLVTGPAARGTVVQAWITPPAYTGLPPLFLHAGTDPAPIPIGSHLTVSVTGGHGAPVLRMNGESTEPRALDAASWQAERDLDLPGRLSVARGGSELAGWNLAILPDRPPSVVFTEPPGPGGTPQRPTLQTRLGWRAEDDYGVVSVQAELRLKDRPAAPPLVLVAPVSGSAKTVKGVIGQDLTAHPWAGLRVVGRMVARDAPGQIGVSGDEVFDLPERPFMNPAARAVIAIRKQLSLTPEERRGAKMALDALADRPELYDNALGVMLTLRATGALLQRGRGQPAVDEAQSRLWALALALEEGAADRTARALEQARQAMRDAMDAAKQNPEDKAAQDALQKRMEELREAIQRHVEALTEQARRDGTEMPFDPSLPQMNPRDLDRMAQEMEKSAREGRMEDAQRQMAELEKLLEQLQNARPERSEEREQRNAERRQRGQQQTDAVQDMIKREGALLDRSQARQNETAPRPPDGLPPSLERLFQQNPSAPRPNAPPDSQQAGKTPQGGEQQGQDRRAQNAMRRALGELMQRFGDLTGQIPAPLSDADMAMRDAGQALDQGREAAAGAATQRAIEALQKGGRAMSQQLARQFGRGEQDGDDGQDGQDGQDMADGDSGQLGNGDSPTGNRDSLTEGRRPGDQPNGARRRGARRDPLGRPLPDDGNDREQAMNGQDGSGRTRVPEEMEQARTRALQEELRRRGADRTRPQPELDYIDRLLKSF